MVNQSYHIDDKDLRESSRMVSNALYESIGMYKSYHNHQQEKLQIFIDEQTSKLLQATESTKWVAKISLFCAVLSTVAALAQVYIMYVKQ